MKQAIATIRTGTGKLIKRRLPVTMHNEDMDNVVYYVLMRTAQIMAVIEAEDGLVLNIEWEENEL